MDGQQIVKNSMNSPAYGLAWLSAHGRTYAVFG